MLGFIEKDVKRQREELDEWYKKTISECSMAEGVVWEQGISYIDDGKECHKLDIYYSNMPMTNRPVIFDFHGGGLLMGERGMNRFFCSNMAARGYLVFCIDYELVPEADIFTILKDSYEGLKKAYSLIDSYNGDKSKISIIGDSAGAFIATYLAALQNNPKVAHALNITTSDIKITKIGAISPMFYSSRIDKIGLFVMRRYFYGKNAKKHPFWRYVNPECGDVMKHVPKIYAVTCEGDYLRSYPRMYIKALKKVGIECELLDFTDEKELEHDFVIMQPRHERSVEVVDWLSEKLR